MEVEAHLSRPTVPEAAHSLMIPGQLAAQVRLHRAAVEERPAFAEPLVLLVWALAATRPLVEP